MNLSGKLLLILFCAVSLVGCDGMDATYKDFIKDGPVVYIGKVDSLKAYAGRNRVMLEWQKLLDPRAKTVEIFWENRSKSVKVKLSDLEEKEAKIQYMMNELDEGTYVFEICTYDDKGNSSIMSEVPGVVYGEAYEQLLFNTRVESAKLRKEVLTIQFASSQEDTFIGSEITYTSTEGEVKTIFLEMPDTELVIDDFSGNKFSYRSVYLPEETAIDYFYSASDEYSID